MKVDWLNEKENLERLIKEGVSYERIGRQYDVTGSAVKKAAKKLGIELEQKRKINPSEHFNKGTGQKGVCLNCGKEFIIYKSHTGKYCSHSCQLEYQYKEYIKNWKEGKEDGMSGSYGISEYIRRYLFEKYDGKCQICGWGKENPHSHHIPLQIHHTDGDYKNNKEENLQLLCPNCHSLTDTFGVLNKNGRKDRKKYKRRSDV